MSINFQWLGRIDFESALQEQSRLVEERKCGNIPDTLLLLEHPPVYTIGRTRDQTSLGNTALLPHPVVEINRGGKATYHGPGQLVGYAIFDLTQRGRDLHKHLRFLETGLQNLCRAFAVDAEIQEGLTGLWMGQKKLASIGVGVRQWISMHGFGLNVTAASLEGFRHITPCGLQEVQMTCMEELLGCPITIPQVVEELPRHFSSDESPV